MPKKALGSAVAQAARALTRGKQPIDATPFRTGPLADSAKVECDDLRARLDQEAAERRQLTARIIDQRKPQPGLWARLWGAAAR